MTSQSLIFETELNDLGAFECTSVSETVQPDEKQSGFEQKSETNQENERSTDSQKQQQPYYIDPSILDTAHKEWVEQASMVFQQGLKANMHGVHSEYFMQVQAQFERMYADLQSQMAQYPSEE